MLTVYFHNEQEVNKVEEYCKDKNIKCKTLKLKKLEFANKPYSMHVFIDRYDSKEIAAFDTFIKGL